MPSGSILEAQKSLRILFLKNDLFVPELHAGTELSTHYLSLSLLERGHSVAVAASSNRPEVRTDRQPRHDLSCGYPVYRARRFVDAAVKAIEDFRPDIVVCQEPDYWIGSAKFGGFKGIAVALYQHSRRDWLASVPAFVRDRAVYFSNSEPIAAFLKTSYGIHSVVIPPVFGVDRFAGIQRNGNNVLFVSLQVRKGADIAIEIARATPDVTFIFLESWTIDPHETALLRETVATLPNVKLLPNQGDLQSIFQMTRLLLMPSRSHEGWGRTATEAQLCGIPVLGSSRGQLGATIGPGGIALDPDAGMGEWLRAFDSIWKDERRYADLSSRAVSHARHLLEQKDRAIRRFESCLIGAVKREQRGVVHLAAKPKPPRPKSLIAPSDFKVMGRLARLAYSCLRSPVALDVCNTIAGQEIGSLPDGGKRIAARIAHATGMKQIDCQSIAVSAWAARNESALQVLRGHMPSGWHPNIVLEGRHRLDAALARGTGAVLWMAHFAFASTVVKMALHAGGYRLGHFSRPEHGFSKSRFGIAVLNPIRTSFEDRYLSRRIVYRRQCPGAAFVAISDLLAQNGVVSMTAGAWEGSRVVEAPFLGSTIRLATGPVRVAREESAPLLPVFGIKTTENDDFSVWIGEEIDFPRNKNLGDAAAIAVRNFLGVLSPVILAYPGQWRGWSDLIDA